MSFKRSIVESRLHFRCHCYYCCCNVAHIFVGLHLCERKIQAMKKHQRKWEEYSNAVFSYSSYFFYSLCIFIINILTIYFKDNIFTLFSPPLWFLNSFHSFTKYPSIFTHLSLFRHTHKRSVVIDDQCCVSCQMSFLMSQKLLAVVSQFKCNSAALIEYCSILSFCCLCSFLFSFLLPNYWFLMFFFFVVI